MARVNPCKSQYACGARVIDGRPHIVSLPVGRGRPNVGVARGWPARLGRTGILSAAGRHGSATSRECQSPMIDLG